LFTAGFLASQGFFDIVALVLVFVSAAIIGDSVGYAIGQRFGRGLFDRPDSRFFKRKYLDATEAFYDKHGGKTLILARFVPIIRTFAPTVAGVAGMPYRRFLMYNVVGGLLWGVGVTLAGYWLGNVIPDVDRYLLPIIFVIIVISLLPTLVHIWKEYRYELRQVLPWGRRQPVAVESDSPEA
jgi:membrane-associated protein